MNKIRVSSENVTDFILSALFVLQDDIPISEKYFSLDDILNFFQYDHKFDDLSFINNFFAKNNNYGRSHRILFDYFLQSNINGLRKGSKVLKVEKALSHFIIENNIKDRILGISLDKAKEIQLSKLNLTLEKLEPEFQKNRKMKDYHILKEELIKSKPNSTQIFKLIQSIDTTLPEAEKIQLAFQGNY